MADFSVFGPTIAYDKATGRGAPGVVGVVSDVATGEQVSTYNLAGAPAPVITNSAGYVPQFQTDPGVTAVKVRFGAVELVLVDQIATLEAGKNAQDAAAAAVDAAGLVGAPADAAMAAAIQATDSDTHNALDAQYGDGPIAGLLNTDGSATNLAATAIVDDRVDALETQMLPAGASAYDTGWVDITLNTGFAAGSGASPQVRRIGKVVYVRGQVTPSSGNFATGTDLVVGTIPAAFRPPRSWADRYTPLWPNPSINSPVSGAALPNGNLVIRVPATITNASSVQVGAVGPYPVD